jgi:aspartokinase
MQVRIEKIGGENSAALRETLALIEKNKANSIYSLYVFSAFRTSEYNTTTELLRVTQFCRDGQKEKAREILIAIKDFYKKTLISEWVLTDTVLSYLEEVFIPYEHALDTFSLGTDILPSEENDYSIGGLSFLWAGEVLTTSIYRRLIFTDTELWSIDPSDEWSYQDIPLLLEKYGVVLSPGYYGWLSGGIIGSWGRGYSDATAARIHDTIKYFYKEWDLSLAIRKMYPICSADPRRIDIGRVKKIDHISLKLLLEMIGTHGAGSQFINQNAANVSFFEKGGKLQIYTESDPIGSIVSLHGDTQIRGFLFVQSKALCVFNITSYQFNTPGYNEHLAHFFSMRKINIDNIVTSQTEISITLIKKELHNHDISLIANELSHYLGRFEVSSNILPLVIAEEYVNIYIGGERISAPGALAEITRILATHAIDITLMMQPLYSQVIIVWVNKKDESSALECLHRWLIETQIYLT